ncbi:MAG: methyltransferase domain-containing protein [Chloroflexota bacterium]
MSLDLTDWHQRFIQQARWTQDLRRYLFERARLTRASRTLEVGCGTGALLESCLDSSYLHGLDISAPHLYLARFHAPRALLVQGDAHALPYAPASFDLTFCHFLLLWVKQPENVIAEMVRITRPGGSVLALAEPDYGGRIDFPDELAKLANLQQTALRRQGADPLIGRRLASIFASAGLQQIETGVLGGQWQGSPSKQDWENEWQVLLEDIGADLPASELESLRQHDHKAWLEGSRVLFVPTFYAWGRMKA